jgi:hypothetical protein
VRVVFPGGADPVEQADGGFGHRPVGLPGAECGHPRRGRDDERGVAPVVSKVVEFWNASTDPYAYDELIG